MFSFLLSLKSPNVLIRKDCLCTWNNFRFVGMLTLFRLVNSRDTPHGFLFEFIVSVCVHFVCLFNILNEID